MENHVNTVVRSCYLRLRNLGKLRPMLTLEASKTLALSTIISRIDNCNSVLWGLPDKQLKKLQKLQNTAARIVTKTKCTEHITPILQNLHWLPVSKRIDHKILSLTYACVNDIAPVYLKEVIPLYKPSRSLRSDSVLRLCLPSVEDTNKTKYGFKAFKNSAPKLWNTLPLSIRKSNNISIFKKKLKTHLFTQ